MAGEQASINPIGRPRAPSLAQIQAYDVNRAGEMEAVRQSIYDFQTYAALGQTQLTFFQLPVGQGGKTLQDTNMLGAGALPNPIMQLVQSIEVLFFPAAAPHGASAGDLVNDNYLVAKSGWLEFFIGSKAYLREAPIGRFPPKTVLKGFTGDPTVAYAQQAGRPYNVDPWILLKPTQNFNVTLNWTTAVPLTAAAGRIAVVLDGIQYRNSQ